MIGEGWAAGEGEIAEEAVVRLGQISQPSQGGVQGRTSKFIVKDIHWGP